MFCAGTFFLAHFDIAHAGFPNVSNDDRFMLKFVFARTSQPAKPTWSNERDYWSVDSEDLVDAGLYEPAASFIWNRMREDKTTNNTRKVLNPGYRIGKFLKSSAYD